MQVRGQFCQYAGGILPIHNEMQIFVTLMCEKTVVYMYTVQASALDNSCEIGNSPCCIATAFRAQTIRFDRTKNEYKGANPRSIRCEPRCLALGHWPARGRSARQRIYHHIIVIDDRSLHTHKRNRTRSRSRELTGSDKPNKLC